MKLVAPR